jgi:hypothetical protein
MDPTWGRALVRLIGAALLAAVLLGGVVVGICRALGRWTTAQVGEGLVLTGAIALAAGAISILGAYGGRGVAMGFAASAGRASMEQRTQRAGLDVLRAYRGVLFLTLVGLPLVVTGVLIDPRV